MYLLCCESAYLLIGRGELNLPVDPAGPEQSRVQDVDTVGGHDDLRERERETIEINIWENTMCEIIVSTLM